MDDVAQTKIAGLLQKIERRLTQVHHRNEALTIAVEVLFAHVPDPTVARQALLTRIAAPSVDDATRQEVRRVFAGSFAGLGAPGRGDPS